MFWLVHLVDVIRNKLSEITLGEHDHRYHSLLTTSCFFIFPSLGLIECHWSFQFFFFFAGIDSLINRKWPSSELFPSLVKESLLLGEFLDPIFSLCMCLYLCLWIFSPREQFYGGKSFGVCVYQTKQLWLNHTP